MNHLPRIFGYRNKSTTEMNSKKKKQPKLQRRNAVKNFNYDAQPSSSSPESSESASSSASILCTRSMDFHDRKSFRVEGVDGEFDIICRSLGLNGPEDFSIPAAAWEAMKFRSSSDVLPRLNVSEFDETKTSGEIDQVGVVDCDDRVLVRDSPAESSGGEVNVSIRDSPAKSSGCCTGGEIRVPVRGFDETSNCSTGSGGIKGIRPPMLKPPPGVRVSVVDDTCSTWDILRDFAPEGEGKEREEQEEEEEKVDEVEEKEEVGELELKVEEEENGDIIGEFSRSCSFTTSQEDDSSSTTTDTRSNSISPNVRLKPVITPGSWQKGELLGRGSFGTVYEGISEDGFFFAVKQVSLLDQGSQGKQSVVQLEHEIALLSQFEHENIVRYIGTEMDESNLYIFIEFVTKGSLLSLYRRYKLRDSQVSAYTRQILHGLKYLHDRNIVHRDIKCANILVDANGSVKVADFGLAKAIKLNDVKSCQGTAFWMAPEVVRGKVKGYGLPADIWSLGCTVLEMLTGKIPYSPMECISAMFRIGKGELPPVPDTLSRDARDFILQCLKVNPDDRPTAAQLLDHKFVQRSFSQSSGSASPHIPRRG
uniref:mitogen-activated protein kinase kinase kinase n=1 Tax=Medicago sativa TaxID=3879 RepID=Q7XTK4_MEDSA|nr:putative mitogen-activated protein kinase 1 [Medicago sativa]